MAGIGARGDGPARGSGLGAARRGAAAGARHGPRASPSGAREGSARARMLGGLLVLADLGGEES